MEAFLVIALAKRREHRFATTGELAGYFHDAARGTLPIPLQHRARALLQQHHWTEPEAPKHTSLKAV